MLTLLFPFLIAFFLVLGGFALGAAYVHRQLQPKLDQLAAFRSMAREFRR